MKYIGMLFLLLCSCAGNNRQESGRYFSLEKYFTTEAARLQDSKAALFKTAITGNEKESKTFDEVNWLKELKPFIDCDINKPAWKNSYNIDSVHTGDSLAVTYSAVENIAVRKIEIASRHDSVVSISISRVKENIYYKMSEDYYYNPLGYEIKGQHKVRLTNESNFMVDADFKIKP